MSFEVRQESVQYTKFKRFGKSLCEPYPRLHSRSPGWHPGRPTVTTPGGPSPRLRLIPLLYHKGSVSVFFVLELNVSGISNSFSRSSCSSLLHLFSRIRHCIHRCIVVWRSETENGRPCSNTLYVRREAMSLR